MRSAPSPKTSTTITSGSRGASEIVCCGKSAGRPYCISGQTAINMIKSTSRISISGTTFISAMVPSFEPPSEIPMSAPRTNEIAPRGGLQTPSAALKKKAQLLPGLELGRDQADSVDSCTAHDVNGAGNFHEQYIVVALDESNFLGALLENRFQPRTEPIPGGVFV